MKPTDFVVGMNYYDNLGRNPYAPKTANDTKYMCVAVTRRNVIFTYTFQGVERVMSALLEGLPPERFTRRKYSTLSSLDAASVGAGQGIQGDTQ